MGCCIIRQLSENSCEILLRKAELRLGLMKIKSKDMDRVLYRNSTRLKMNQTQFKVACRNLGLNTNDEAIIYFFDMFYTIETASYSVRLLSLLGILYGNSLKSEKILLLFQNYDEDSSKSLGPTEITHMIEDISKIYFEFMCSFAFYLYPDADIESLIKHKEKLRCIRTALIQHLSRIIMEDHPNDVSFEEFSEILEIREISYLLSGTELRQYSVVLMESIIEIAEKVNKFDEIKDSIDEPTARRLGINIKNQMN